MKDEKITKLDEWLSTFYSLFDKYYIISNSKDFKDYGLETYVSFDYYNNEEAEEKYSIIEMGLRKSNGKTNLAHDTSLILNGDNNYEYMYLVTNIINHILRSCFKKSIILYDDKNPNHYIKDGLFIDFDDMKLIDYPLYNSKIPFEEIIVEMIKSNDSKYSESMINLIKSNIKSRECTEELKYNLSNIIDDELMVDAAINKLVNKKF